MEFSIKAAPLEKGRCGCIVVGVYELRKLTSSARALDEASKKTLSAVLATGDLDGAVGSSLLLHSVPGVPAARVLLVGLGPEKELSDRSFREVVRSAVRALQSTGSADALLLLGDVPVAKRDLAWKVEQLVLVSAETTYRITRVVTKPDPDKLALKKLVIGVADKKEAKAAETVLGRAVAVSHGVDYAKDLGNLPPNICTPSYLADRARDLGKTAKLKVEIVERAQMEKLGMGSLLSVSHGSRQPPKLIIMHHQGGDKKRKPIALVGKGVTFDTGGISIKPAPDMDEMKFDMCGAASVFGTLLAIAEMKLPINVVGIVPAVENMPDGAASRPGDIVTSLSGQTVEILNTDAEGRLILCDALTYAERFQPEAVVDIATLTGACVIALGHHAAGLYANEDQLAAELLSAGNYVHDRAWQMPLWDEYQEGLKSNFADMANVAGRPAGSITAACFLARYTRQFRWAHLDIAGVAYRSGKDKGSTGRPVTLLSRFLIGRAGL